MCAACRAEYDDPRDRRFHAQPNACPACGPSACALDARRDGSIAGARDPVAAAAARCATGAIVAMKGIGGYHLACRADDEAAVAALRARKQREDKPFALMVPLARRCRRGSSARRPSEAAAARGAARPIVLCPRPDARPWRRRSRPGAPELGVMLPYSPLHHLLLADAPAPRSS